MTKGDLELLEPGRRDENEPACQPRSATGRVAAKPLSRRSRGRRGTGRAAVPSGDGDREEPAGRPGSARGPSAGARAAGRRRRHPRGGSGRAGWADEAQDVLARPQAGRQDALEVSGSDPRRRLLVRVRDRGCGDGVRVPDPAGLSVPAGAGRRSHRVAAPVGCGREPSRAAGVARVHAVARRASLRRRHRDLQRHRAEPPVAGRGRCAGPGGGDRRGGLPCRGGPRTARPHAGRGR